MKYLISWLLFVLTSVTTAAQDSIPTKNEDTMNMNSTVSGFSCLLTSSELVERKHELQQEVFSEVKKVEEVNDGFLFHFNDDEKLLSNLFYYILAEKACCPFFQQDISIGSDHSGITWKVSGKTGVKEVLQEMLETIDIQEH